jgi:hypothetical protein
MGDMSRRKDWTKYSREKEARLHSVVSITIMAVLFMVLYNNGVSSSD